MSYLLGIDLGGTKLALGAVSTGGDILAWRELETRAREGAPRVIARMIAALRALQQSASLSPNDQLLGIGIGVSGPLDLERGRIHNPHTLPTFDDVDIVTPLVQEFFPKVQGQAPVVLENDCDVAVLGEAWLGAGRRARNVVCVTVGTGIGAGLILDGHLYHGVGLTSGEFGHLTIEHHGIECYCGNHGCLEMLAAGPAIAKAYQARTLTSDLTARDVIDAARAGDPIAGEILDDAAQALGVGLAGIITLLAPDVIVLGGGVMDHFELFAPTLYATVAERATLVPARRVRIRRAALGKSAGVIGAAKAVLERVS